MGVCLSGLGLAETRSPLLPILWTDPQKQERGGIVGGLCIQHRDGPAQIVRWPCSEGRVCFTQCGLLRQELLL